MHPDVNHNEYVEGCKNKQRPVCRCCWGLQGGRQGGRTQPPPLHGRFRGTRGAASSSWLTSAAARGLSGRDKFPVRTGSALKQNYWVAAWVGALSGSPGRRVAVGSRALLNAQASPRWARGVPGVWLQPSSLCSAQLSLAVLLIHTSQLAPSSCLGTDAREAETP